MKTYEEQIDAFRVYEFAADNNIIAADGRFLTEHFDAIQLKERIKEKEEDIKRLKTKLARLV